MSRTKQTIINMFSSGMSYAVPMAVNLFATPYIVKSLGTAAYGLQNLVNLIIGYLTIMDMGLDIAVTKNLAEDRAKQENESENRLLNTSLLLYGIVGLIGLLIIFFGAGILARRVFSVPTDLQPKAVIVFQLASAGFLFSMLNTYVKAVCNGLHRYDYSSTIGIISSMGGIGLGILALLNGYGLIGFVFSKILFIILVPTIAFFQLKRLLPNLRLKFSFDGKMLKRLWSYMAYGVILRITGAFLSRIDHALLGIWIGVTAVGLYSVPYTITTMISYGIASILGFLLPMASELHNTNKFDELQILFVRLTVFVNILCSAIFLPMLILGKTFLTLWMGNSFAMQTYKIFFLLLLASYISTLLVSIFNLLIIGIGKMRAFTIYGTIRAVFLCTACFALIKPFGISGAAFAALSACAVDAVYFIFCLTSYLKMNLLEVSTRAIIKPMALSLLLCVPLFLLNARATTWVSFISIFAIYEATYFSACYFLGIIEAPEKQLIKKLIRIG
jgi:O-antigen/teichoic acid export membrane protein